MFSLQLHVKGPVSVKQLLLRDTSDRAVCENVFSGYFYS